MGYSFDDNKCLSEGQKTGSRETENHRLYDNKFERELPRKEKDCGRVLCWGVEPSREIFRVSQDN